MHEVQFNVTPEQRSLLKGSNYSLRPLSASGHLSVGKVVQLAIQPTAIFLGTLVVLTMGRIRYSSNELDVALVFLVVGSLLLYPAVAFALLAFGIISTKLHSRVRWSAALYWTYWPFCRLALCAASAYAGVAYGNFLWYNNLYPYMRIERLQKYYDIDPLKVSGLRLQDAGVVEFNMTAGVDRMRTGCLKNGVTYCVAPVLSGDQVIENSTDLASYDIFMTGVNCCSCPGEFRCGDWNRPGAAGGRIGGLRVVNADRASFYRLAVEEWASTHGKVSTHPLFFEWVAEPVNALDLLWRDGRRQRDIALLCAPFACIFATWLLNGVLNFLVANGYAAPIDTPLPSGGIGQALGKKFLPHMYKHQMDMQEAQGDVDPKYVLL